jgi:hypothetical protein
MLPPPRTLVYRYHAEYVVTYRFEASGEAVGTETYGPTGLVDPTAIQ